jgi:hypothetical protein
MSSPGNGDQVTGKKATPAADTPPEAGVLFVHDSLASAKASAAG